MARVCVRQRYLPLGVFQNDLGSLFRRPVCAPLTVGVAQGRLGKRFEKARLFASVEGVRPEGFGSWTEAIDHDRTAIARIDSYLDQLSEKQRSAATETGRVVRVIAGPGSGKTRVLIARIAHLLLRGNRPHQFLVLTFTNKAANEMNARLQGLLRDKKRKIYSSGTFHSIAARILRRHIQRLGDGRTGEYRVIDEDESVAIVLEGLMEQHATLILSSDSKEQQAAKKRQNSKLRVELAQKAKILAARFSDAKDRVSDCYGLTGEELAERYRTCNRLRPWERSGCTSKEFARCYDDYNARLKARNSLDFGDLIACVIWLFKTDQTVLDRYRYQYRHILIDEMQDINEPQYELLHLLMVGRQEGYQDAFDPSLFAVGDPNQSIYSFRGAQAVHLLKFFEKDFPEDVTTHMLLENYRSTPPVVRLAEEILRHCIDNALYTEMLVKRKSPHLKQTMVRQFETDSEEAEFVAGRIRALIYRTGIQPDEIAILYRFHSISRCFETSLSKNGIPHTVRSNSFWDTKEVKDIMAYLRLVCDPSDTYAFNRIYNVPKRGLGVTSYSNLQKWCLSEGHAFPQYLFHDLMESTTDSQLCTDVEISELKIPKEAKITKKARAGLHALRQIFVFLRSVARERQADVVVRELRDRCGYFDFLVPDSTVYDKGISRKLRAIEDLIQTLRQNRDPELNGLEALEALVQIAVLVEASSGDEEDPKVQLMSIHASKGLEFEAVFVVGCEQDILPGSVDRAEDIEEEARLLFVATTRAKSVLTVSAAQKRFRNGEMRFSKLSCFVPTDLARRVSHEE